MQRPEQSVHRMSSRFTTFRSMFVGENMKESKFLPSGLLHIFQLRIQEIFALIDLKYWPKILASVLAEADQRGLSQLI